MSGVRVQFRVDGADRMVRNLRRVRALGLAALRDGADDLAAVIVTEARALAPVDTGELRAGIQAERSTLQGDQVRGAVVAGVGVSAPYALIQHEDLTLQHPGGGGPKFLERAVNRNSGSTGAAIAGRRLRRLLGGR